MMIKENVLKFCVDTGIRIIQRKIKHCKISQMYAKLSLLESINIYIAKSQPFAKIVRTYYAKAREP